MGLMAFHQDGRLTALTQVIDPDHTLLILFRLLSYLPLPIILIFRADGGFHALHLGPGRSLGPLAFRSGGRPVRTLILPLAFSNMDGTIRMHTLPQAFSNTHGIIHIIVTNRRTQQGNGQDTIVRAAGDSQSSTVYRPQVGVIANIVKNMLRLSERPHVHLGLPPVHVGASTGGEPLLMPGVTTSRGPVFQITVPPRCIHDPGSLQRVVNVLKDELVANMNPWYRHAGFMFRTSRNTQMHRRRYWVPPSLVYCWDHAMQSYTARYVEPPRGDIREVLGADGVGDTTEDDQADLVDEMWDDEAYESGRGSWACEDIETHPRCNIKVPSLCPYCQEKKADMDKRFNRVKTHIAEMRRQLQEKYEQCQSHLEEATTPTRTTMMTAKVTTTRTGKSGGVEGELESAREFMRKKRMESDAHLMMFWDYR
ncbi:hypothetical protein F5Y04DRAFT_286647 [Hypomontagnella monticulosa]|nr:hypothetical protein F5Y04DRAFT_286647 [Hypomontagnella monticulosa]